MGFVRICQVTVAASASASTTNERAHRGILYGMVDYRLASLSTYTLKARAGFCLGRLIMRARQLIDGASFGPDALKAIGDAFDAAWAEISGTVPAQTLSRLRRHA
mgnify:CR=1 FL=1